MKKSKDYAEAKAEILDRLGVERLLEELGVEVTGSSGDYLQAHCPLPEHDDQNPSFSVHSRTGWAKCFGCDFEGSFFDLWAELRGLGDFKEAVEELADRAGVDLPTAKKRCRVLTVAEYAKAKGLPEAWLRKHFRLEDTAKGVKMPYRGADGEVCSIRYRCGMTGKRRFVWEQGAKPYLYGLWFLSKMLERGLTYCLLVEGESDTQTAIRHRIPCLGVPGANTMKPKWAEALEGFGRLYLIDEGDIGAKSFICQTYAALVKGGYTGPVYRVKLSGVKDISELHLTCQKDEMGNAYDRQ